MNKKKILAIIAGLVFSQTALSYQAVKWLAQVYPMGISNIVSTWGTGQNNESTGGYIGASYDNPTTLQANLNQDRIACLKDSSNNLAIVYYQFTTYVDPNYGTMLDVNTNPLPTCYITNSAMALGNMTFSVYPNASPVKDSSGNIIGAVDKLYFSPNVDLMYSHDHTISCTFDANKVTEIQNTCSALLSH